MSHRITPPRPVKKGKFICNLCGREWAGYKDYQYHLLACQQENVCP